MRTKKVKLYKFEELSKEAQEKVIQDNYDINVDYDWWTDELHEFCSAAKKIGFDIDFNSITFSLDRDAHFGMEVDGISTDDVYIAKTTKVKGEIWTDIKFNINKVGYYRQEFPCEGWYRSDSNSKGWYELIVNTKNSDDKKKIEKLLDNMIVKLVDMCAEYYKIISDTHEDLTTEDSVKDTLIANDYEFNEDGTRDRG